MLCVKHSDMRSHHLCTDLMSSYSPSGGMKLMLRSESNLLSRTHWWKVQSSIAMDCLPLQQGKKRRGHISDATETQHTHKGLDIMMAYCTWSALWPQQNQDVILIQEAVIGPNQIIKHVMLWSKMGKFDTDTTEFIQMKSSVKKDFWYDTRQMKNKLC